MPQYAIRSALALTAAGASYAWRSVSAELPNEGERTVTVAAPPVEVSSLAPAVLPSISATPDAVPIASPVAAVEQAITRRLPRRIPIRLDLR